MSLQLNAQQKVDSLRSALDIETDVGVKVSILLELYYELHRTNPDLALEYAYQAETLSENAGLEDQLAYSKYRVGTMLITKGLLEKADQVLREAQSVYERLDDASGLSLVMIELAKVQHRTSNLGEATRIYLETLPLLQETGNQNGEARVLNYLGSLYRTQKQTDKAIEYYQKALDLVEELDFKPGISACLMNLGMMYRLSGEYKTAIDMVERSIEIKRDIGDKLGLGRGLDNLGKLLATKGDHHSAIAHYNEALKISVELKNVGLIRIVSTGLAESYYSLGQYEASIRLANEVLALSVEATDLELDVQVYALLSDAYEKSGNVTKAYEHAKMHITLSDSLYNEQLVSITNDLEARYQNEQNAREIASLEAENQLQQLQIENRKRERNYLLAVIGFVLLLSVLIYNQYRVNRRANAKLKELDQLKSEFLANISHEFRTPLSLIMAPLKQMMDKAAGKDEEKTYGRMYKNAESLYNLINQLLDLSKLEHGVIEINKNPTDINHFLKVLATSFTSMADQKKIDYRIEIDNRSFWVELDQDIIQKICSNLLSNAFKFTPEGEKVEFIARTDYDSLIISVKDTGSGIPSEDQEKVFERFYQSNEKEHLGTGIGLALTRQLANLHGGKIELVSSDESGSEFRVIIPVSKSTSPQSLSNDITEVAHTENGEFHETIHGGPVVLIVEDNDDLRQYLNELLGEKYDVHQSVDGQDGINKAKELVPDLIISDVKMPKKDGIALCNELKEAEETDHIPIILLTARADQESKLEGLRIGVDDYLLKPFDPTELHVRIENLLDQRNRLKEKYGKLLLLETKDIVVTDREGSFLKKLMEVLNENLANADFSVEQLSAEVAMSRMQLHRKLTALTGHSASTFIRNHRLEQATRLLEAGESVSQVAYAVGFSSPSYFTRAFKEVYDVAPSEYSKVKA